MPSIVCAIRLYRRLIRVQIRSQLIYRTSFILDLLAVGLRHLDRLPRRDVTAKVPMSHPEAYKAYEAAGFQPVRVLDQMRLDLRRGGGGILL